MKKIQSIFILVIAFFTTEEILSQNYFVDSTFGENGIIVFDSYGVCYKSKINEANDKILIGGRDDFLLGPAPPPGPITNISALYRIQNCIGLDSSYGVNGRIPIDVSYPFIEGYLFNDDGSAYLYGYRNGNWQYPYLDKVDTSGFFDLSFNLLDSYDYQPEIINFEQGRILHVHKDETLQKLLCVGSYNDGLAEGIFYRYFNLDGSIDSSIYTNGIQLTEIYSDNDYQNKITKSVRIDNERYLFFGITENNYLTSTMVKLDGTIDESYGSEGTLIDSTILPQQNAYFVRQLFTEIINNSVYVGTLERVFSNTTQSYVYETNTRKYNTSGQLDSTFGTNGKLTIIQQSNFSRSINLTRILNNKLLISYENSIGDNAQNAFIIDEDGQILSEFNFNFENSLYNYGTIQLILDIAFTSDNKLLLLARDDSFSMLLMRLTQVSSIPNLSFDEGQIQSNLDQENLIFHWFYDGTELSSENTSNIEFQGIGEYIINVYNIQTCGSFSDTIVVDPVKLSTFEFNNIKVYPNPACNEIIIDSNLEINNIRIIDMYGKMVFIKDCSNQKILKLSTKHLKQGVYNVLINNKVSRKIIITN